LGLVGTAAFGSGRGMVDSFDAEMGLGSILADTGRWLFHCTAIADGSRDIAVGTVVQFKQSFGGPGRWEAFDLTPVTEG
jgi:cold shock CspA family protein